MVKRAVEGGEPSVDTVEVKSGLLNPDALFERIRNVGIEADWSEDEHAMVSDAYELASMLHENDTHRGLPYIYHLLENARILIEHFHIRDPRIIAAALYHDIIEDHPRKILRIIGGMKDDDVSSDPEERIKQGLVVIKEKSTEMTAVLVKGMTNPIKKSYAAGIPKEQIEELRLSEYIEHAREEVKVLYVWMLKFADWVHNGVGIIYAEKDIDSKKLISRGNKYSKLMKELRDRYDKDEFLIIFPQDTTDYIEEQFRLGSERLAAIGFIALGETVEQ